MYIRVTARRPWLQHGGRCGSQRFWRSFQVGARSNHNTATSPPVRFAGTPPQAALAFRVQAPSTLTVQRYPDVRNIEQVPCLCESPETASWNRKNAISKSNCTGLRCRRRYNILGAYLSLVDSLGHPADIVTFKCADHLLQDIAPFQRLARLAYEPACISDASGSAERPEPI